MKSWTRTFAVVVALLCLSGAVGRTQNRPLKLLVVLVVDQMRADYVDKFQHQWTQGLRRLVDQGAWFRQAAYPYLNTITCAGHATIATGAIPAVHGLILNAWWDRSAGRMVSCTEDDAATTISYGRPIKGGHSARRLLVPALGDELRAQLSPPARVVTFSLKPRSAIMLAGHHPTAVTWLDDSGAWATSSAYADAPVPFIDQFIKANPIERDAGQRWERALAAREYLYAERAVGKAPPPGLGPSFPHVLKASTEAGFYDGWQSSPFADAYLGRLATAAVEALNLGRSESTDLLGVGFSVLDRVGHAFGPDSHEVQDVLVRLDRTVGTLLGDLDRLVGRDRYVVALSADHGVAPIPERMTAGGLDAGRVNLREIADRVEKALSAVLGPDKYVARLEYTDLYFAPGVYEKLVAHPAAMQAVVDTLRASPGVWRVFHGEDLQERGPGQDPVRLAASRSYYPGRSGDVVIVPKPYWMSAASGTTHGTSHAYDQRVPIILMGPGIVPGIYLQPASPVDIAPTLALLAGVTLAEPSGRVLAEALKLPVATPSGSSRRD